VSAIKARGLRTVAASSAKRDELEPLLAIAGAGSLMDEKTSGDDAEASKPDPDIVHAALDRVGAKAADALMIGDTPYDVDAARQRRRRRHRLPAGGGWTDADLEGAIAVYDGPWGSARAAGRITPPALTVLPRSGGIGYASPTAPRSADVADPAVRRAGCPAADRRLRGAAPRVRAAAWYALLLVAIAHWSMPTRGSSPPASSSSRSSSSRSSTSASAPSRRSGSGSCSTSSAPSRPASAHGARHRRVLGGDAGAGLDRRLAPRVLGADHVDSGGPFDLLIGRGPGFYVNIFFTYAALWAGIGILGDARLPVARTSTPGAAAS
jgi:hypothetical protein